MESLKVIQTKSEVLQWSPLPLRKEHLTFTQKSQDQDDRIIRTPSEDLYPNCDVSVWLRSCDQEIIDPIKGTIKGEIPNWLQGCLYRNGPGSLKVGNMEFAHLFDSSALLHRFAIKDGEVTYQCRFLETEVYKRNQAAQRIVVTEFGTSSVPDPCETIFHRISSMFAPSSEALSDNAMISIYPFGDELYAFTESPVMHRFHPDTLATEGKKITSKYINIVNHTSHPHVVPNGSVYNLGLSVTKYGPAYSIVCFPSVDKDSKKSMFDEAYIVGTIPARWSLHPSYMHTFGKERQYYSFYVFKPGITKNYFIIVEQPLSVSVPSMVKVHLKNEPFAGCLQWFQDKQTCINVLSRKTGKLEYQFYAETFFYLHIINQYELNDEYIVLDICCYRDPGMLDCMYIETMRNMQKMPDYAKMFRGRPLRFVLPLKSSEEILDIDKNKEQNLVEIPNCKAQAYKVAKNHIYVVPELLCDLGCETPRINYDSYLGHEYRYFYAISSDVDADNPGTIIKVDTKTKTSKTWCEDNCYPSEPIFVPRPNSTMEDDGIVLASLVWGHEDTHRAGMLVLDAKTWREIGRAEFATPGPVPKCLHGWFSDKHGELKKCDKK